MKFQISLNANGSPQFGEVKFYFRVSVSNREIETLALVSLYSPPDQDLLEASSQALWACQYLGDESLCVINVKTIISVVAIVPLPHSGQPKGMFVVEKLGLDVAEMGGSLDEDLDETARAPTTSAAEE
jgi:hypothetical protein